MIQTVMPELGRRRLLAAGLTVAGALLVPTLLRAQQRMPTPAATAGPFYPPTLPADIDNDLVVVRGAPARAQGIVTHITGRVLNAAGRPVPDAQVEIWQCDAPGRYLHPGSGGSAPRDAGFQGFGRARTGADGAYSFRTIKPVPYTGRTPHIHVKVKLARRELLTTQLYVEGDAHNERDFLWRGLGTNRSLVTVPFRADAEGLRAEFPIVVAV